MEHHVTEEPSDRSVHVEGSKPGARRRKGELADCNRASSHLGTRCRSVHVEGSKPGGMNGKGELADCKENQTARSQVPVCAL